jgi:hypothetical protein
VQAVRPKETSAPPQAHRAEAWAAGRQGARVRKGEEELRQVLDLTPQLVTVYGPKRERIYGESDGARVFRHEPR